MLVLVLLVLVLTVGDAPGTVRATARSSCRHGQLKTRHAPGTSFEPYPIPVLAEPKLITRALDQLRYLKTFDSPNAVNTTTGPQLPKYISHAFDSLDKPWKPGYLRSA